MINSMAAHEWRGESKVHDQLASQAKRVKELEQEVAELRRDAERYAWIKAHVALVERKRECSDYYNITRVEIDADLLLDKQHWFDLDAAIDAAMKEATK